MEPPSHEAVVQALDLLKLIGALDDEENLTALGSLLANMPVPPQLGKMMFLACIFQCLNPILNIAAVLGYREPFCTPLGKEEEARRARNSFGAGLNSDHLTYHEAMKVANNYSVFILIQNIKAIRINARNANFEFLVGWLCNLQDYVACVVSGDVPANKYCWDTYMFPSTCTVRTTLTNIFWLDLRQFVGFLINTWSLITAYADVVFAVSVYSNCLRWRNNLRSSYKVRASSRMLIRWMDMPTRTLVHIPSSLVAISMACNSWITVFSVFSPRWRWHYTRCPSWWSLS